MFALDLLDATSRLTWLAGAASHFRKQLGTGLISDHPCGSKRHLLIRPGTVKPGLKNADSIIRGA